VIVPDLGGFVANYRPAEMDLASNSFSPPRKEIIFSSKLDKNDGLLVNHISESEGVGYLEARLIISEFVDEVKSKLENGEKVVFSKIGNLQYDHNERFIFEIEIHENLLLDAFGLEDFQFPQIKHHEVLNSKRPFLDKEAVRPVFNSRRIKRLVIGIPLLLALLIIPATRSSWKNHSFLNNQTSGTASIALTQPSPINLKTAPATTEINSRPEQTLGNSIEPAIKKEVNVTSTAAAVEPSPSKYHIIGGCFKMKENADKLLDNLKSRGYKSKLDQFSNGTFMVTVQSYSDKNEALLCLNTLRDKEPQAGYWMQVK